MTTLVDTFGVALFASVIVVVVTAGALTSRHIRDLAGGWARIAAVGATVLVIAATAMPWGWPPELRTDGDLVLAVGGAGLGDIGQALASPGSLAAALLVANVLLYVPVGVAVRLGWPSRPAWFAVGWGLALTVAVETVQRLALGRVASTDDVILNLLGVLVGIGAAAIAPRWLTSAVARV